MELVVQKDGLFESDIEFEITSEGMLIGDGVFGAGGTESVTTFSVFFTAPDDDIALQDDVVLVMNLTLLMSNPVILLMNSVIAVVVQDNEGINILFNCIVLSSKN